MSNKKKYRDAVEEINRYLDYLYDDRTPVSHVAVAGITVEELINLLEYTKKTLETLTGKDSNE